MKQRNPIRLAGAFEHKLNVEGCVYLFARDGMMLIFEILRSTCTAGGYCTTDYHQVGMIPKIGVPEGILKVVYAVAFRICPC
ncbi:MAG: hypothetical protein E4H02_08065, partial [Lentisphaerales bacterium]